MTDAQLYTALAVPALFNGALVWWFALYMNTRFDAAGRRLDAIEMRLDRIEKKLDGVWGIK